MGVRFTAQESELIAVSASLRYRILRVRLGHDANLISYASLQWSQGARMKLGMEMLESSVIRHLILKAKLTEDVAGSNFQISDVVRTVIDTAVKNGSLPETSRLEYSNTLADKITAVIWELIIEGVYTPGTGVQTPSLPYLRTTEHGRKCFETGELTAHDPDDYLGRLKTACPSVDEITLLYTGEPPDTFRAGNHLASAVMIGVAAEKMLLRLVGAVKAALSTAQRKAKFEKDMKGKNEEVEIAIHAVARRN